MSRSLAAESGGGMVHPRDAPCGVGRNGEREHPLVPVPVLYSDTAVNRGR